MSVRAEYLHWRDFRSRFRDRYGYRYRFLSRIFFPKRNDTSWGREGLDLKVEQLLPRKGFYVELGANDGYTQSNTLRLEIFGNWRGVLIEPLSSVFIECVKNRNPKRNSIFQAACVAEGFNRTCLEMAVNNQDKFTRLWASALGLETTIRDNAEHSRALKPEVDNEHLARETVPARTLTSILIEANAPQDIDFMSIDVEGAELEVLKGLDFRTFMPVWICVETSDYSAVSVLLKQEGYSLHDKLSRHDYMFHRARRRHPNG